MKRLLSGLLVLWIFSFKGFTQDLNDAVVYIQGDKQIPIYLKMEGEMQNRLSKNYFILDRLASGPLNIEVLFQQNKYPAQKFVINVTPSSQRAFTLQKLGDDKFALYDVNYGFYLNAGNKLEDDIDMSIAKNTSIATINNDDKDVKSLPVIDPVSNEKKNKPKKQKESELPEFVAKSKEDKKEIVTKAEKPKTTKETKKEENRFLEFEMDKGTNNESGNKLDKGNENILDENFDNGPKPISDALFQSFVSRIDGQSDEEQKLKLLRNQGQKYYYTVEQVGNIASKFELQSSRFEVVNILKSKIVDSKSLDKLSELFKSNYLKERFKSEILR